MHRPLQCSAGDKAKANCEVQHLKRQAGQEQHGTCANVSGNVSAAKGHTCCDRSCLAARSDPVQGLARPPSSPGLTSVALHRLQSVGADKASSCSGQASPADGLQVLHSLAADCVKSVAACSAPRSHSAGCRALRMCLREARTIRHHVRCSCDREGCPYDTLQLCMIVGAGNQHAQAELCSACKLLRHEGAEVCQRAACKS